MSRNRELTIYEKHQLRVALDTMAMPDSMAGVMGMTKAEALDVIRRLRRGEMLRPVS